MDYTKLTIDVKDENRPPLFIGSQIRGALGYSLKKVMCINPVYVCENCFAKDNCLYFDFFEKQNISHKFRLDFELAQNNYTFNFYLFDNACQKLPYIISAFHKLLTKIGLGKERKTFNNFDMFVNDILINGTDTIQIPKNYIKQFELNNNKLDNNLNIHLKFITPLRMKKNGIFIRDNNFELKDIINSIYQRERILLDLKPQKIDFDIKGEITHTNIKHIDLTRKSNRQKTFMKLGGIVGHVFINNLDIKSYRLLKLGELIGIGKQTVFGLGKIKIYTKE